MEDADAGKIAEIYNHYIAHSVITFEEVEVAAPEILRRIEKTRHADHPWLVAEENQSLIGYAYACQWHERSAYRHTVEISIYLSHIVTGRGVGSALYKELFHQLSLRSVHVVIGGIALPNAASAALHEKFGMKKVAHFDAVGYKFDQWIDVGYWQIVLGAG